MCVLFNKGLFKIKFFKYMFIMDCSRLGISGFIYVFKVLV